ncbi:MAG: cobalamin biosynthesis protein CobD [Firmicutes bacterium]|nr:cobalamin biosynthesis protein CobD [Bacillota bacterium]
MLYDLAAAFLLDLALGDPRWLPHPVRMLGWLIARLEGLIRRAFHGEWGLRLGGVLLAVSVVSAGYLSAWLLLQGAARLGEAAYHAVDIVLLYTLLCTRSLDLEARQVHTALVRQDIAGARHWLSRIVGRDTQDLTPPEVARGAVETVAENLVDGIISPLLFILIGGAPLGMAFKAVSTLDSMVGYRNERYRHLGWASARLDDIANWIPARLAGWVIIPLAAWLTGLSLRGSWRVVLRDSKNHSSPNSGWSEAAFAGALGIQVGGTNYYFGKPVFKPTIGDGAAVIAPEHIIGAIRIMYVSSVLALLIGSGLWLIIRGVF